MTSEKHGSVKLEGRGLISIKGGDVRPFLQGLITNDMKALSPEQAVFAALLTPQGKYLFDFFMADDGGRILLDCERDRLGELLERLTLYRLRADVQLVDVTGELAVWALLPEQTDQLKAGAVEPCCGGLKYVDPRLGKAGFRLILPRDMAPPGETIEYGDYERLRIGLGLADGSRDIEVGRQPILEAGFAELAGVDFKKGCYVGQEVTARMKYRGTLKKRLLPVVFEGSAPDPGTRLMAGGKRVGDVRSGIGNMAIALVRLEFLQAKNLETDAGQPARVMPPDWLLLDGAAA